MYLCTSVSYYMLLGEAKSLYPFLRKLNEWKSMKFKEKNRKLKKKNFDYCTTTNCL